MGGIEENDSGVDEVRSAWSSGEMCRLEGCDKSPSQLYDIGRVWGLYVRSLGDLGEHRWAEVFLVVARQRELSFRPCSSTTTTHFLPF
jgi:hypothetical protein